MCKRVLTFLFVFIGFINLNSQVLAENDPTYMTLYVRDLQTQIKENWEPVLKNYNYAVIVIFRIEKSGELVKKSILHTSGSKFIDAVALDTIEKSKPYKPLPREFNGKSVDFQFTFKYTANEATKPLYIVAVKSQENKKFYTSLDKENKEKYNQYLRTVNKYFKTIVPQEYFPKRRFIEITFTIQEDGKTKDIIMTKSSDNHLYNELVKTIIQNTTLPNIPIELGAKELKFKYSITSEVDKM